MADERPAFVRGTGGAGQASRDSRRRGGGSAPRSRTRALTGSRRAAQHGHRDGRPRTSRCHASPRESSRSGRTRRDCTTCIGRPCRARPGAPAPLPRWWREPRMTSIRPASCPRAADYPAVPAWKRRSDGATCVLARGSSPPRALAGRTREEWRPTTRRARGAAGAGSARCREVELGTPGNPDQKEGDLRCACRCIPCTSRPVASRPALRVPAGRRASTRFAQGAKG